MLFLILFTCATVLLAYYLHKTFTYWERRKIPSYPAPSYLKGHMQTPFNNHFKKIYDYFKLQGVKHGGFYFFHQPIYMPIEPDLLKRILTKDFEYFTEKGLYTNERKQPINGHLFAIGGDRWKKLRVKLTPTFTSGKLKHMFPTIVACSKPLVKSVETLTKAHQEIDIKDFASKFTTDVIGSCAFGIECNSFDGTSTDFHYHGKKLMTPSTKGTIKRMLGLSFPKLCRALGMTMLPPEAEQFYTNIARDTIDVRKATNTKRNDFLQLLLELLNKDDPNQRITIQDIINQSFVFYIAGFETSSSVMTYTLVELSKHTEIQDKLRAEIQETLARYDNEITYDGIQEMKYLGQVVDEALRKYPPVTLLNRECSKDYHIPDTDIVLEKGTKVFVPIYPLQFDEEYYPEPEKFDPERFCDEVKKTRHAYTFIPFGEGPRQCIGLRFGYLQTKIGLVTLLRRFKFTLDPSVKYPLQFSGGILTQISDTTILLKSTPL